MSKVVTSLTVIAKNEVSDEDRDALLESRDADSLSEVASEMEESVEAVIAQRVFGDADTIALLDVNTEVEE
jgi:hypothetical protein